MRYVTLKTKNPSKNYKNTTGVYIYQKPSSPPYQTIPNAILQTYWWILLFAHGVTNLTDGKTKIEGYTYIKYKMAP